MAILDISKKTDVLASYADWLTHRLNSNEVYIRTDSNHISHIEFNSSNVDYITLRTKNPQKLYPLLSESSKLKDYNYYIEFTLTAYNTDIEPSMPDKMELVEMFKDISKKTDKRVVWRYEPIIFTQKYNIGWHIFMFRFFLEKLADYTDSCVISFATPDEKIRNKIQFDNTPKTYNDFINFCKKLNSIAESNNIALYHNTEGYDIEYQTGIRSEKALTKQINKAFTGHENLCTERIDIGKYNTCTNNCLFCSKNNNDYKLVESSKLYDPQAAILCDMIKPTDIITDMVLKTGS